MKTFADAERVLADALPGYESRPPQQALAEAIEQILARPENFAPYTGPEDEYPDWEKPGLVHLFGQAGTGTGKSLAYLIPAILSGKRIVVSVTTKALQDQIVSTDLPFLTEHLGVDFSWALLKGRSNYVCKNRLGLVTEQDASPEILRQIWEATQDPTFTGLREEIDAMIPDRVWSQVCSESEECSSNKCKVEECYAERARDEASRARLIIANHALFLSDLMQKSWGRNGMLDEYDLVVFDEAHALEEVAGNTLGATMSEGSFNSYTSQVRRWATDHADDEGESLQEPIDHVTNAARALFAAVKVGRLREGQLEELTDELGAMYDALDSIRGTLAKTKYDHAKDPTRASKKRFRLVRQAYSLLDRLTEVIAAPADEVVRWVEEEQRRGEKRKVIKTAPILVAPFLYRWLFSKTPAVLVSATLAVRGNMAYIAGRLGIRDYGQIDVGTPFDYPTQGQIYVPISLPDGSPFPEPSRDMVAMWESIAIQEIHRLVNASRGRALVLFTSIKHMKATAEALRRMPGDLEYRMQGETRSNRELVDWLKDHASGGNGRVLLATKSFFTGVDIPGEALSMLIITKMPFPVPTEPLTEARCEAIEMAGGSSFRDYTIPVMSLELQQGVGRLIRHTSDRGVAAILDPRLVSKPYGRGILRDLPPMASVHTVADVETFFEQEAALAAG